MSYRIPVALIVLLILISPIPAGADEKIKREDVSMSNAKIETLSLSSEAFKAGELIPRKYTCDGADISPPLSWSAIPDAAAELVLICEDPDAPGGTWIHWVLYGLSPETVNLAENVPKKETIAGVRQGKNSFGKIGYGGPCPPRGSNHRYFFRLYAIDKALDIKPGQTRDAVMKSIEGHILAMGELMGRFSH